MHAGEPDHHRTEACRPGERAFVMSREVVGESLMTSYEFVWGSHLFCHAVSPGSGDDVFRRCLGEKPSPYARGW
ncbi:MAG: hypothetical protein RJB14_585 [Pseudomonadota bacterium]